MHRESVWNRPALVSALELHFLALSPSAIYRALLLLIRNPAHPRPDGAASAPSFPDAPAPRTTTSPALRLRPVRIRGALLRHRIRSSVSNPSPAIGPHRSSPPPRRWQCVLLRHAGAAGTPYTDRVRGFPIPAPCLPA